MKKLIKDNYDSIIKRGLITDKTTIKDFTDKLYEEVEEVNELCYVPGFNDYLDIEAINKHDLSFEIADVILTALNFAKHYNIDIERILKEKIEINNERANKI